MVQLCAGVLHGVTPAMRSASARASSDPIDPDIGARDAQLLAGLAQGILTDADIAVVHVSALRAAVDRRCAVPLR